MKFDNEEDIKSVELKVLYRNYFILDFGPGISFHSGFLIRNCKS
jgi:hypothetical protein